VARHHADDQFYAVFGDGLGSALFDESEKPGKFSPASVKTRNSIGRNATVASVRQETGQNGQDSAQNQPFEKSPRSGNRRLILWRRGTTLLVFKTGNGSGLVVDFYFNRNSK
jgi:hypothetical protein